jgi:hypothetical protein
MVSSTRSTSTYTREPDLVVWEVRGSVRIDDVRELFASITSFAERKSGYFLLVLVNGYDGIDSDARKLIVELPKRSDGSPIKTLGTATVGASFHVRVTGTMVSKAAALLSGGVAPQVHFAETEEEALAWIAEQRRILGTRESEGATHV